MTNIIKNAVEAIEQKVERDGPANHHIRLELSAAEGFQIVRAEDSGIGLPAEREKIVEPYMTTRAEGTGLGLAIVKRIVEDHGGSVDFADRPGGGAIVTLTLSTHIHPARLASAAAQTDTHSDAAPRLLTRLED